MSRVFITGSTAGIGLGAAHTLVAAGHRVTGHARNEARAEQLRAALPGLEDIYVGDLSSATQTSGLADRANRAGGFDAVIHNAGVGYQESHRVSTGEDHSHVLAVNVLAPYLLTALMHRPSRLIYISSAMHRAGDDSLYDIDWTDRPWDGVQAYADSKLFSATLALAVARHFPGVLSNAVEPAWVPTKVGGPGAPGDLSRAHVTQVWLAVSADPAATVSGGYFYERRPHRTHPAVWSAKFQDELLDRLSDVTAVSLRR